MVYLLGPPCRALAKPADLVNLALELEPVNCGWDQMQAEVDALDTHPSTGPCNPPAAATWSGSAASIHQVF
jgi:hypothetical protein